MRAAVVVLAAGSGTRLGAEVNKVLLPLAGVPIVARSVRTACAVAGVSRVVLVVRDGEQDAVRAAAEPFLPESAEVAMVAGGTTRHGSAIPSPAVVDERASSDCQSIDRCYVDSSFRSRARTDTCHSALAGRKVSRI